MSSPHHDHVHCALSVEIRSHDHESRRSALILWAQVHGLDPHKIVSPSTIEVEGGQATFEEYVFDTSDRLVVDDKGEPMRRLRTIQILEPLPEGVA